MEISRYWRLQKQRYGLVGLICNICGEKMFPPREVCPSCAQGLMARALTFKPSQQALEIQPPDAIVVSA